MGREGGGARGRKEKEGRWLGAEVEMGAGRVDVGRWPPSWPFCTAREQTEAAARGAGPRDTRSARQTRRAHTPWSREARGPCGHPRTLPTRGPCGRPPQHWRCPGGNPKRRKVHGPHTPALGSAFHSVPPPSASASFPRSPPLSPRANRRSAADGFRHHAPWVDGPRPSSRPPPPHGAPSTRPEGSGRAISEGAHCQEQYIPPQTGGGQVGERQCSAGRLTLLRLGADLRPLPCAPVPTSPLEL